MYHRENRYPSDWRIPQNYSGSTFRNTQDEVREATEELTRNEPPALPASAEEKDEGRTQPAVLSRSSRMDFKRILRGELTAEEARSYPGRNYITRAVGTEPTVESDLFAIRVERGDALLLSSDGLHNEVDDQEILFEVVHGVNNDNCCQRLLDIANMRGSPDNVTSVLVMA